MSDVSNQTQQSKPFKIRIYNHVIKSQISNHAFYLYIILRQYARQNRQIYIYSTELLDLLQWQNKRTLKKYLQELKQYKIIDYPFTDFPINKPLIITINFEPEQDDYTQVDTLTIKKIITAGMCVELFELKNKDKETKTYKDLKEHCLRLFYIYEMYYNPKNNTAATPSYTQISSITKLSNKYIKSINNLFEQYNFVKVQIGQRHNNDNKRKKNAYIPILDR